MIKRSTRVADLLQQEIGSIILQDLRDPRIGFVTVTGATMSDDLKHAKVFVSVMGTDQEVEQTFQGLESARGYIQKCIGQRLKLRDTPEISFRPDTSVAYGTHIDELLKSLQPDTSGSPGEEER